LFRKGREEHILDIAASFEEQYKRHKGITSVRLRTASELNPAVIGQIREILQASPVTSENVELSVEVDPALIGGLVIELDDRLYDASIRHKLSLLKKEFKDNLYISQVIAH
jgi:F-type H+-transporting ATPase subunit delta